MSRKCLWAAGLIGLSLVVLMGIKSFRSQPPESFPPVGEKGHVKGNPNAAFQIVEFFDFQCPACAQGAKLLHYYVKQNPDKFYLQVKNFPLSMHTHALRAAEYAECAAEQGAYWSFHDYLMNHQSQWRMLEDAEPFFQKAADELALNKGQLQACLNNDRVKARILEDKEEGTVRGVRSTPTYFINDQMVVGSRNLRDAVLDYLRKGKLPGEEASASSSRSKSTEQP